jgi:uncharacterized Zn finger protein
MVIKLTDEKGIICPKCGNRHEKQTLIKDDGKCGDLYKCTKCGRRFMFCKERL